MNPLRVHSRMNGHVGHDGMRRKTILTAMPLLIAFLAGVLFLLLPLTSAPLRSRSQFERVCYYWSARSRVARCMNILGLIETTKESARIRLKLTEGETVTLKQLEPFIAGPWEGCPSGGEYSVNPLGVDPECSIHGSRLNPRMD